jgi:hypothetical protein
MGAVLGKAARHYARYLRELFGTRPVERHAVTYNLGGCRSQVRAGTNKTLQCAFGMVAAIVLSVIGFVSG